MNSPASFGKAGNKGDSHQRDGSEAYLVLRHFIKESLVKEWALEVVLAPALALVAAAAVYTWRIGMAASFPDWYFCGELLSAGGGFLVAAMAASTMFRLQAWREIAVESASAMVPPDPQVKSVAKRLNRGNNALFLMLMASIAWAILSSFLQIEVEHTAHGLPRLIASGLLASTTVIGCVGAFFHCRGALWRAKLVMMVVCRASSPSPSKDWKRWERSL